IPLVEPLPPELLLGAAALVVRFVLVPSSADAELAIAIANTAVSASRSRVLILVSSFAFRAVLPRAPPRARGLPSSRTGTREARGTCGNAPASSNARPGEIGAPGFEPGTSPTRTVRATRLRHAPKRAQSSPGAPQR